VNDLRYEVHVKFHRRWHLIAKCSTEDDARVLADERARDRGTVGDPGVRGAMVKAGKVVLYKLG
jgi:hypothetical protein